MTNDPRKDPAGPDDQERQEPIKDKPAEDPGEMLEVKIDPGNYDPTLDPNNPEFDNEKFNQSFSRAREALKEALVKQGEFAAAIAEQMNTNPVLQSYLQAASKLQENIAEELKKQLPGIDLDVDLINVDGITMPAQEVIKRLATYTFKIPPELRNIINETADEARRESAIIKEVEGLEPYLAKELKKKKYGGRDLDTLWDEAETTEGGSFGNPAPGSLFLQAIKAARAARDRAEEKEQLPAVHYNKTPDIALTIGKASYTLFDPAIYEKINNEEIPLFIIDPKTGSRGRKPKDIPGQLSFFPMKYERDGKDQITLYCGIEPDKNYFSKLGLSGILDDEDYFNLSFIGDAYLNGNTIISARTMYKEYIGGDPKADQLTNFVRRLDKLAAIRVHIDDRELKAAWSKDDPTATYKFISQQVANLTIGGDKFVVNGQVAETNIKINEFPALLAIDQEIGQYTTVPKSLLQVKKKNGRAPRREKRFYKVLHYLVRRIARIKNGGAINKIRYATFYEDMGETTPRGRQLARDMMFIILDHFVREKWITGYKEEVKNGEAGLKFSWNSEAAKQIKKRAAYKEKGLPNKK